MTIKKGARILFTGDSITDCCRDRADLKGLTAYSKMVDGYIKLFYPEIGAECFNRGISGNRTIDLLSRMGGDLSQSMPNAVSMLIGINDVWRRYDSNDPTSDEQFEKNYRTIIAKIKEYTNNIIVLEPFIIPSTKEIMILREDLEPKMRIIRKIAAEEKLEYIPLDGIFAELSILNGPLLYSADGVHLTEEGYRVLTKEWLKRTNLAV